MKKADHKTDLKNVSTTKIRNLKKFGPKYNALEHKTITQATTELGPEYSALEHKTIMQATKEFGPEYSALEHKTITHATKEFGPKYSALEHSTITQATTEFGPEYSALEHSTTTQATKEFDPKYSAPEDGALTSVIANGSLIVPRLKTLGTHGLVRETCDEITTLKMDLVTTERDVSDLAQRFATEVRTWDPSTSDTSENHLPPSLPPGGESLGAEGGANLQVKHLPNTCTTSKQTNPRIACTLTEPSKAANLTLTSAMNLLIIKTWGNPRGDLVKPVVPVLPLMSKFWSKSNFGPAN